MNIYTYLLLLLSFTSSSQGLRGGEMELSITSTQKVSFDLKVYSEYEGIDSLLINWGDGGSDTLIGLITIIPNTDLFVSLFANFHDYDSIGVFEISIKDSFLIENVINIEDSGNKYLKITDSVYTHDFSNEQINFISNHNEIEILNNGAVLHKILPLQQDIGDFTSYELIPFTNEGYSFPQADSISISANGLYWDAPSQVGTFAFAIRANEFRIIGNEVIKLSTKTRYMMMDVDSSMLVSNKNLIPLEKDILIFPNPAQEYLNINLKNFPLDNPIRFSIVNILGQNVYSGKIFPYQNRFNISFLSSGTYFIVFQNGKYMTSKIITIQK